MVSVFNLNVNWFGLVYKNIVDCGLIIFVYGVHILYCVSRTWLVDTFVAFARYRSI